MSCISATKMIIFFITIFPKYTVNNEPSSLSILKAGSPRKTILFRTLNKNALCLKKTMEDSKPHELSLNNDYQSEPS